jgi:hypothetical protein
MPTGLTLGRVYYSAKIDGTTFNIYDNVTHALAAGSTGKIILANRRSSGKESSKRPTRRSKQRAPFLRPRRTTSPGLFCG